MDKGPLNFIVHLAKKSIGFLLFVVCSVAIYYKVLHDIAWNQFLGIMYKQLASIPIYYWGVLFILFFLNFFIEAFKWKLVLTNLNPIGILKSFETVFIGQAFAFFTPNRIGEYAGRTLLLNAGNKLLGMAQMAWSSYAQLLVTIVMGSAALYINSIFYPLLNGPWLLMVKITGPVIACVALVVFLYEPTWKGWFSFLNKIKVPTSIKFNLLGLSFLRYLVFLLQYLCIAKMLNLDIGMGTLILSVAILFLCLSILPTISLTELVVRGQLLLLLLAPFCQDQIMIVSLSTFVWGVNFLLPAIIGALLLLRYRLNQ